MERSSDNKTKDDWWREWFNHVYQDVYSHRDENQADNEIQGALDILPLKSSDRILDLCCGNGRHCRALKRAGWTKIIGADYSFPLLKHAISEPPRARYLRADMRLLPFGNGCFDALLSFFTSFGYFKTNVENLSVLHEISRVLKPGGYYLLDYLNPSYVKDHFEPETVRKHGEFTIRERRWFTSDGERVEKEITIDNWGGKDHRYHESVRLYEFDEMKGMLESAELVVQDVFGSFDGTAFDSTQPRMILFGPRQ